MRGVPSSTANVWNDDDADAGRADAVKRLRRSSTLVCSAALRSSSLCGERVWNSRRTYARTCTHMGHGFWLSGGRTLPCGTPRARRSHARANERLRLGSTVDRRSSLPAAAAAAASVRQSVPKSASANADSYSSVSCAMCVACSRCRIAHTPRRVATPTRVRDAQQVLYSTYKTHRRHPKIAEALQRGAHANTAAQTQTRTH